MANIVGLPCIFSRIQAQVSPQVLFFNDFFKDGIKDKHCTLTLINMYNRDLRELCW